MTAVFDLTDIRPTRPAVPPPLPGMRLPQHRDRDWRAWLSAFVVHVGIVALALWPAKLLLDQGAGRGPGPRGGGGGQGGARMIALEAYRPPAAAATTATPAVDPVPIPVPSPEIIPLQDLAQLDIPQDGGAASSGASAGSGPGSGGGTGSGVGTGTGADRGPGTGGDGSYILLAKPRGVFLPPECLRGRFQVRFSVGADGRVTSVETQPVMREAACRRDFETRLRGFRFDPATTRDGTPVASIYPMTVAR